VHYDIASRRARLAELAIWAARNGRDLAPGEVLGVVPRQMSADGYMPITPVTEPDDYAALASLMGPGEILGTIPAGSWRLQEVTT
jgi:hypothetical protein